MRGGAFPFFFFFAFTCRRPEWSKRDPRREGEKEFRAGGGRGREAGGQASQRASGGSFSRQDLVGGSQRKQRKNALRAGGWCRAAVVGEDEAPSASGSCPSSAAARPDRACQWSWRI